MSDDAAGGVQPYSPPTLPGAVLTPTQVVSAQANLAHQFFNVVRHLIEHAGAYRNESTQTDHLAVVQRYENALTSPAERRQLLSEDDRAPREDVTQRTPFPGSGGVPAVAPAAAAIDYNKLAAAIVAQQAAMAQSA